LFLLFLCCIFVVQNVFICVYGYNQWSVLQHVCSPHPTRVLWFEARLPKRLMVIRVISAGLRSFHHVLFPFLGLRPHWLNVRMYQYFINNNNILVEEQFGFRTKSSTMAATFNLINEIIEAFN